MPKLSVTEVDRRIGNKIQIRRKELGLTAAELSEKIGISQQQLSRYERGTNKINVTHLVNIAYILKEPIGWFFSDCHPDIPGDLSQNKVPARELVPVANNDLSRRFWQQWGKLTVDQRRALIVFLDYFGEKT
ncbi:helix-turn-helix transcriptional regulator [Thiomicrorhabdus sp.]|uniref:helix-turn-helix domain-containing protein n=1 Tax=Thiomicrorhabdus sp. TaxID=2039724 RepID=UPI0029C7FBB6|nr:helix-turn-helix transcriptional regulator [Thiomicrorhabdus sp.]